MQDRSETQTIFRPQAGEGQRIAITGIAARSAALPLWKTVQIWTTKGCWIEIGDNAVVVSQGKDFPVGVGGTYEYMATGGDDRYISVIEDAAEAAVTGFFMIGQAEQ
jgi:hypothetical protein